MDAMHPHDLERRPAASELGLAVIREALHQEAERGDPTGRNGQLIEAEENDSEEAATNDEISAEFCLNSTRKDCGRAGHIEISPGLF
jgi:hypothetical protein